MSNNQRSLTHADIVGETVDGWLERLRHSVTAPVQDGRVYPGFPSAEIQRQFVGSAFEDALREAGEFYRLVQHFLAQQKVGPGGGYLDFGCGWGRIGRFFLRDFDDAEMAGVDIDPGMVELCRQTRQPGRFETIANGAPLPFEDGRFRLATAYSVFTHLPPHLLRAWLAELVRVLKPGGVLIFTIEPPRFLDFLEGADPASDNAWLAALAAYKDRIPGLRADLARDGVAYLPSGGGDYREADVYGDTVVTRDFLAREAKAAGGELAVFLDDPASFWQAVAVIRRPRGGVAGLLERAVGALRRLLGRA